MKNKSVMYYKHVKFKILPFLLFQEYIVDNKLGAPKEEFLERVTAYNSIISRHLLTLEAVFFNKVS